MPQKGAKPRCPRCNAQHRTNKPLNEYDENRTFNPEKFWPKYPAGDERAAVEVWYQDKKRNQAELDLQDFEDVRGYWLDQVRRTITQSTASVLKSEAASVSAPDIGTTEISTDTTSSSPLNLQPAWPDAEEIDNKEETRVPQPLIFDPRKDFQPKLNRACEGRAFGIFELRGEKVEMGNTNVHAIRPGFATKKDIDKTVMNKVQITGKPSDDIGTHVLSNHFKVVLKSDYLYYYEVTGFPIASTGKRTKSLIQKLIKNCPCLSEQKNRFATDNRKIIVAWDDISLHKGCKHQQNAATPCQAREGEVIAELELEPRGQTTQMSQQNELDQAAQSGQAGQQPKAEEAAPSGQADQPDDVNGKEPRTPIVLQCTFKRRIDLGAFRNFVHAEKDTLDFNWSDVVEKLNIVFASRIEHVQDSRTNNLFKTVHCGKNKFFRERVWKPLRLSNGPNMFRTVRGYYFTVTAGMGDILLNVNTCMSAFYNSKSLSDFIKEYCDYMKEKPDHLTDAGKRKLMGVLKGVEVRIQHKRGGVDPPKDPKKLQSWNDMNNTEKGRDKSIAGIGDLPQNIAFDELDVHGKFKEKWTVSSWMTTKNGVTSVDTELPCINLGSNSDPSWFLADQLWIKPYQLLKGKPDSEMTRAMIGEALRTPSQNYDHIMREGLQTLGLTSFTEGSTMSQASSDNFAITIVPQMLKVPFQLIPRPKILYLDKDTESPQNKAQWNLEGHHFCSTNTTHGRKTIQLHVLYEDDAILQTDQENHENQKNQDESKSCSLSFQREMKKLGIQINDARTMATVYVPRKEDIHAQIPTFKTAFETAKANGSNLVMFVSSGKPVEKYAAFKKCADQQYGIQSICLLKQNWMKKFVTEKDRARLMANLGMKVNLKFEGVNHQVEGLAKMKGLANTMILGADVTHPGGGVQGTPSIAAVVGSVDPGFGKFLGSMRRQPEARLEIIDFKIMKSMVEERLRAYAKHRDNNLPDNILYYRDGIDDGQYTAVRTVEVRAIREAYDEVNKDDKGISPSSPIRITAIVVAKRHHKRFYPTDKEYGSRQGSGNCYPGTCVEAGVVSPWYNDFYLQSHNGIKGTAKPAHYFVLQDGIGIYNDIQKITYHLCHTYARSTSGVSYATPAYYADRLCKRGRHYLRRFYDPTEEKLKQLGKDAAKEDASQEDKDAFKSALDAAWDPLENNNGNPWHPNLNNTTFWM